jgi:hypothetical protein
MYSVVDLKQAFTELVPEGRSTIDEGGLVAAIKHYDIPIQHMAQDE